jgi:hypothetical protein
MCRLDVHLLLELLLALVLSGRVLMVLRHVLRLRLRQLQLLRPPLRQLLLLLLGPLVLLLLHWQLLRRLSLLHYP